MIHIGGQKMIGEYLAMVVYDAMFDRRCQTDVVTSEALIRHSTCDFARAKSIVDHNRQAAHGSDLSHVRRARHRPRWAVRPAAPVKGPSYTTKQGKMPVLDATEAE